MRKLLLLFICAAICLPGRIAAAAAPTPEDRKARDSFLEEKRLNLLRETTQTTADLISQLTLAIDKFGELKQNANVLATVKGWLYDDIQKVYKGTLSGSDAEKIEANAKYGEFLRLAESEPSAAAAEPAASSASSSGEAAREGLSPAEQLLRERAERLKLQQEREKSPVAASLPSDYTMLILMAKRYLQNYSDISDDTEKISGEVRAEMIRRMYGELELALAQPDFDKDKVSEVKDLLKQLSELYGRYVEVAKKKGWNVPLTIADVSVSSSSGGEAALSIDVPERRSASSGGEPSRSSSTSELTLSPSSVPSSSRSVTSRTSSPVSTVETPVSARSVGRVPTTAAAPSRRAAETPSRAAAVPVRIGRPVAVPTRTAAAAPVRPALSPEDRTRVAELEKSKATSGSVAGKAVHQQEIDLLKIKAGEKLDDETAAVERKLTDGEKESIAAAKASIKTNKSATAQKALVEKIHKIIANAARRK